MRLITIIIYTIILSAMTAGSVFAQTYPHPPSDVEYMQIAKIVSEETLCPDLPACPEPEPCPEQVSFCPIEKDDFGTFNDLALDARRYMGFLREEVYFYLDDRAGGDVLEHLVAELDKFFFTYRNVPGSEEALYLKARIYRKWREHELELVSLLKIIYEYPDGAFSKKARIDAGGLFADRLERDFRDNPSILNGGRSESRAVNQANMLENLVKLSNKKYLEIQMKELDEFLAYYPRDPKSDLMMTFKSNNYIRQKNYDAAAHTLRRLASFYPSSPMRPDALYMLGLVYSENLKKYKKAVDVFSEIIKVHPGSSQAVSSHERAAELYEKKLDDPANAVSMLEDIVRKYPFSDAALRAFTYMANIQEDNKKYIEAIDAYKRLDEMFLDKKPDDAVNALFEAGRIAEKRLDDDRMFTDTMLYVYERHPSHMRSAEALYGAAYKYEKEFKELELAKKYYRLCIDRFPDHKITAKAHTRLDSILDRERREEEKRLKELEKQRLKKEKESQADK